MKRIHFLLFITNCSLLIAYSQVTQEWVQRYNGTGNSTDYPFSLAVDNSGNIYVTGASMGNGTNSDYVTIKYNSAGIQLWVQRYNGPKNLYDGASSIAVDNFGNAYVTGEIDVEMGKGDYATIKYNSSGELQWVQIYNGTGDSVDYPTCIAVDKSGNVYVSGSSIGPGANYDYATIKYNTSGIIQWVQGYNGPGNNFDRANSIAIDISGYIYITGASSAIGDNYDYATIKYNSSGIIQWVQRYNSPQNDYDWASSIAVDNSGNVYITGQSAYDYATIKYNTAGIQQWIQVYNGPGNDYDAAGSIAVDDAGNIIVTGSSKGNGTYYDYATIKYSSQGSQLWVQRYGGTGWDAAMSIKSDPFGNVYITGESEGDSSALGYVTIKYNSLGSQQWVQRYTGPMNNESGGRSIAIDTLGNVYVTGYSMGSGSGYDYATIKYSQSIGIEPISTVIPAGFRLEQNYPNPFNPITNIKFYIPKEGYVSLKIYDMTGAVVQIYFDGNMKAGTYNAEVDGSNFSSGVYFYTLTARDFTETKKMVLIK